MSSTKINILVYADEGVGIRPLSETLRALRMHLGPNYAVQKIFAKQIIEEPWEDTAQMIVFPGGRDLPYMKKLHGIGNDRIRKFVEDGGKYLGLCAGGYYGSSFVEFERDTPLQVIGARDLCFFKGNAQGCVFPGFEYNSERGSHAINIVDSENQKTFPVYFNGGCRFIPNEKEDKETSSSLSLSNFEVLARYQDGDVAVVLCHVGKGKALLSGLHPEYSPSCLDAHDPYSSKILPKLLLHDSERVEFFRKLLKKMELQLQEHVIEPVPKISSSSYVICPPSLTNQASSCFSRISNLQVYCSSSWGSEIDVRFDYNLFEKTLSTKKFGRIIMCSETMRSTQSFLLDNHDHLKELPDGIAVTTLRQVGGIGRGNNVWVSPYGCLMFSLQFNHSEPTNLVFIQYLMALSIVEAIKSKPNFDKMEVKIKWPNDLYIREHKIGGILVNTTYQQNKFMVIVGVGINMWNDKPTTCINKEIERMNHNDNSKLEYIHSEEMLARILNVFEAHYSTFQMEGFEPFYSQYYEHWLHSNQEVKLATENGTVPVILKGLTSSGFLNAYDPQKKQYYELHPDGNRFDLMRGLIKGKL